MEAKPHKAILAPVPSVHLESAFGLKSDIIAFGTNDCKFFDDAELTEGVGKIVVYIFASTTGGPSPLHKPGHVVAIGTYLGYERADKYGQHRNASERPLSARNEDTPWVGYWRVSDLKKLSLPTPFSSIGLYPKDGIGKIRKYKGPPHGPTLIVGPR